MAERRWQRNIHNRATNNENIKHSSHLTGWQKRPDRTSIILSHNLDNRSLLKPSPYLKACPAECRHLKRTKKKQNLKSNSLILIDKDRKSQKPQCIASVRDGFRENWQHLCKIKLSKDRSMGEKNVVKLFSCLPEKTSWLGTQKCIQHMFMDLAA